MRIINKIVNAYTTPEQRKIIKQIGAPAYNAIMKTSVGKTLRDAKNFYTSSVKPVVEATKSVNKKSTTKAGLNPNKSTVLKTAPKGSIFKGDIQNSIINLGRNDEVGAKARQDLVMFLISLGAPAPEAQLLEKTLSAVAKTKGAQAVVKLGKQVVSKVQKATPKQVKSVISNTIATTRNELVKTNPKAAKLINKGTQTLKSKQKEVSNAIDLIFDRQTKVYRIADQLPSTLRRKTPNQLTAEERKLITDKHKELEDFLNKSDYQEMSLDDYLKETTKFSDDELMNLAKITERYFNDPKLIKGNNPKLLTTTKTETQTINKAARSGIGSLNADEADSYISMLRKNSDQLNDLRKRIEAESGEKMKKSDIPNLLNFANQFGDIIKNSPNYIKSQFTGANLAAQLINAGLSIYDVWTAYKENNNSLIPKLKVNTGIMAASALIPNPILKVLFGSLGYFGGDKLANASLTKIGVKHETSDVINREILAGIYNPYISGSMLEFERGASGKKYHVVGNKIFDYATGRPTILKDSLADIRNFYIQGTNQMREQMKANDARAKEWSRQQRLGYNIDPQQIQMLQQENQQLQQQVQNYEQRLEQMQEPDYDPNGDLSEQYKQRVVDPQTQIQEANTLERMRQLDQDAQDVYSTLFKKVSEDTLKDLDKFYTPEALAVDYYQHQRLAARGQMPYMTREEFANWKKLQDLKALEPQIRQQAASAMQNMVKSEADLRKAAADLYSEEETARHNLANENIEMYKAKIDAAYKAGQITINQYKALTDRLNYEVSKANAETNRMNAITNQGKLKIDEYDAETGRMNAKTKQATEARMKRLEPYQQANYMGQTVMNVGMQDNITMDQFLNSNQSVFSQVFPGTQQQNNNNNNNNNTNDILSQYQRDRKQYEDLQNRMN